jgi:hypothetical protein
MQLRTLFVGIALGAGAALISSQAISHQTSAPSEPAAQEQPHADPAAPQQPTPEQMAAMMQEWMRIMQPGSAHELLKKSVGDWESTTEMYLGGPGADPTVTQGTSRRKLVLGGRFILQEENSTMEMPDPATGRTQSVPWNGLGLFGYDNYRNIYVGCWADNMGTQLLTMKGAADPAGNVLTYYGEMDEPMLGVIGRTVKYVTTFVDENTHTFEVYDLHVGDDYLAVRVTYTRVQDEE